MTGSTTQEVVEQVLHAPSPIVDPAYRRNVTLTVALILLVSAALRFWDLGFPGDYMFDEVYYAKDAKAIVDGRVGPQPPLRWEAGDQISWPHPDAGKFAIAAGIAVFGDRAFGWRFPAVVAGLVMLACVYPLARRLGLSPPWALLALALAAADTLGIAQSRIATLDVFVGAWTLVCILLALRYVQDGRQLHWLLLCGAAGGMAVATKWSGALAIAAAAVVIAVAWWQDRRAAEHAGGGARAALVTVGALTLLPAAVYLLSYAQYFAAGHTPADWWELHRQMIIFNLNLEAEHSYASAAPTWIVDYRPVWYYFAGGDEYRGVVAIGNPFLWWAATLALLAAPVLALARRTTLLLPAALLVALLYFPWFAASRTSFLYYMTPVAPLLAILVAAALAAFAGRRPLPRRATLAVVVPAVATALLWEPLGRLLEWVLWTLPRSVAPALGWVAVGAAVFAALLGALVLASPRRRPRRPLVALAVAGVIAGIAVAFIPVVLAIPISPEHFSRITWFPSWI